MTGKPRTVLVVPTVRQECMRQFLDAWEPEFAGVELVVVEDNPERTFELRTSALVSHYCWKDIDAAFGEDRMALGLARIEAHYFRATGFIADDYILGQAGRLKKIPGAIVQGRYDMVCPIVSADALARAWPEASYSVVPDAGHSAMEPGIRAALVAHMERFKRL